ncbi:MAG: cation:proton antiporter [Parachlamydiaceae bacterium]|nr:cation:proton antiporter [Parachlamydiaceae bacterium]
MEIPLLPEIVIIFGLAILVILACHRFKIPSIVGFLLTGVLAGPHGLGFVKNLDNVDILATVGIVLLLFTVGMEFSLKKIFEYRRFFLIGGSAQVFLTVAAGAFFAYLINRPLGESIFLGFLLSLSSTAIILRIFNDTSENDTPHGRLTTGILIFQDIIAIPMMLLTPFLGSSTQEFAPNFLITALSGILLLGIVLFAAAKLVPPILYQIAKTRSRELFLLTVLTVCFAVAWLTSSLGLSLSLGAFLAGLIISESEYRHEAISDILPFQDVFTSFFFISIGMLLDLRFVLDQPFTILLLVAAVLLLKTSIASIAALIVGMPLRTAFLTAIGLSQIGEFSFVLAKNGADYGLTDGDGYQLFLAVSLLTMGLTPTLITHSTKITNWLLKLPFPEILKTGLKPQAHVKKVPLNDHMIIIGYGLNGRNLSLSAKKTNLPYVILEMNPETVKAERIKGEPIFFGDATHEAVLQHADIESAKAAAVVINDFAASRRIVEKLRQMNPNIYIVVRTRYFAQVGNFYQLGANDVIPDELGASVEIFTRVLNYFQIAESQIENVIHTVRAESYEKLKLLYTHPSQIYGFKFNIANVDIESFHVPKNCPFHGKSLAELNLRSTFGISVAAIKRNEHSITKIDAETQIIENDILTVTGASSNIKKMTEYFNSLES